MYALSFFLKDANENYSSGFILANYEVICEGERLTIYKRKAQKTWAAWEKSQFCVL